MKHAPALQALSKCYALSFSWFFLRGCEHSFSAV
uniref:Uncharacterized protein n=1 Tax=Utricularia reniformis TaxID=192314 RepID=A0A1Y0B455_9LAMI|nr:hypothetical protein AEK19_MT2020 [Utricularia reniformis]ART32180.1 hypothetical protein AEK19_MT2020 [Utricularia reniformis]